MERANQHQLEPVRHHEYDSFGFGSITFDFGPEPRLYHWTHTHLSIELSYVEGAMTFDWKGSPEPVASHEVVLFYSGFPHGMVDVEPGSVLHIVQVPIVDVLSWPTPPGMLDRLLAGDFIRDGDRSPAAMTIDGLAFPRWHEELHSTDLDRRQAARLEVEARVRRQLASIREPTRSDRGRHVGPVTAAGVTAAARFIARHFVEPISVDDVAEAVGWNRDHLMASFRQTCGSPLWQYVTRLRLAEAQRLLATTDLPVLAVCHRAGFTSTVRMYDAFKRHLDTTPGQYRRNLAS